MDNQPILETIDPEIAERLADTSEEIRQGASVRPGIAAALALGSVPIALAALSTQAFGQSAIPAGVKGVLDFALALEIFENEFYKAVLNISSSAAQNTRFDAVRASIPAVAVATVQQIQKHETAHVSTLTATGATNVFGLNADSFDFSGGRGTGAGPFAKAFTDVAFLLEVAQGAEDTGVRAYKGQAANLMVTPAILEAALRIHSVEARHASRIRRLRRLAAGAPATVRLSGTVRGGGAAAAGATDAGPQAAAVTAAFDAIYAGEDNTTQGTVILANLSGANFGPEANQEAFDEPLTRAQVVAIVQPFFIPPIS